MLSSTKGKHSAVPNLKYLNFFFQETKPYVDKIRQMPVLEWSWEKKKNTLLFRAYMLCTLS